MSWMIITQVFAFCVILVVTLVFSLRAVYFAKNDRDPINTVKPWAVELYEQDSKENKALENG